MAISHFSSTLACRPAEAQYLLPNRRLLTSSQESNTIHYCRQKVSMANLQRLLILLSHITKFSRTRRFERSYVIALIPEVQLVLLADLALRSVVSVLLLPKAEPTSQPSTFPTFCSRQFVFQKVTHETLKSVEHHKPQNHHITPRDDT
jgi:hypothetical protein